MQLLVLNAAEMVIVHEGVKLSWNTSNYDKKSLTGDYDVTKHINAYWAYLPVHRQEKIFGLYAALAACLQAQSDIQPMIEGLQPLVAQLCEQHSLEEVGHWITYASDISVPSVFHEEYQQTDEKARPRERTYIRSDYKDLSALALALRTLVPVWGEFIKKMAPETGNVFKEYRAFQLLAQTPLMHSVPMEKLRTYVNRNIQMEKPMASAIMRGVGSQDYPAWLLGLVVVRRVCVGDLSNTNPKTNLVTFIHNFLSNKASGSNSNSFGDMIKPKEFESGDATSDMNVSRIEGYKLKQEAPIGDMVILEYYLEDPHQLARMLMPTIDPQMLNRFLTHAGALQKETIWPHQIILTQWVLKPVFPPRGIMQLSKKATIVAIAIAQAVLWQKGHLELACLMTALASNANELELSDTGPRAKITKVQMDELLVLYPYARALSTKKATKPPNAAALAIDLVVKHLSQRDWVLSVPDDIAQRVTGKESKHRYACPDTAKVLLADLVIQIGKRL